MKKTIIYVRGNDKEKQETICTLHALKQGYEVLFVTDDIEKVGNCDILLISNPSRIARDKNKYYETLNSFNDKNINIEFVAHQENTFDYLALINHL